jgi:hypothetical protein
MNKYKLFFFLLLVLFVATIAGFFWYVFKPQVILTSEKPNLVLASPSPVAMATVEPTPLATPAATDTDMIASAMAKKHSKALGDVNLTVKDIIGDYASGGVTFAGEIGGGWWLASKKSGDWVIVADGNGTVMCSDLEGYSFPTSMVSECWDQGTSSLKSL